MPKMPARNRSITSSSEDASLIEKENELYDKIYKVLMAKNRWYTEFGKLGDVLEQLRPEIHELYDWGLIQIGNCTDTLALRGHRIRNQSAFRKLNSMHESYDKIWKKYFIFKDKLHNVEKTMKMERKMLEEHEPQTNLDILKNMTSQELKVRLEIINARNKLMGTWKTALHALVTEWNQQVKPETQDSCNKYYSFIYTLCGKK